MGNLSTGLGLTVVAALKLRGLLTCDPKPQTTCALLNKWLVQIRCMTKVLKSWYIYTLVDLYTHYSIGKLRGSEPLPEQHAYTAVNCQAGKDRKALIHVCSDISIGPVVSSVENCIKFSLQVEESGPLTPSSPKMLLIDSFMVLNMCIVTTCT